MVVFSFVDQYHAIGTFTMLTTSGRRGQAKKLKKRLSGRHSASGNAVEFIAMYDRIQQNCNAMLPKNVMDQLQENKGKHFELMLELLQEQHRLPKLLIQDLIRIHRYYECMINCSPLQVSEEICLLASRILRFLANATMKLP